MVASIGFGDGGYYCGMKSIGERRRPPHHQGDKFNKYILSMENLEDIKVGDRVILYFDNVQSMCEVKRLFKNIVCTIGGDKFRKKDGTMVGAISNPPPYIREATQERILEFEHRKELLCKIHDYPFGKLSTEVLEKVYKLIKK